MSPNDVLYDIQVKAIDGAIRKIGDFAGKVIARDAPSDRPSALEKDIRATLPA
jgi:hypothetical protein